MPSFVSPGVYVIEKDISEYAPTVNSSVVGIVGFASKGPTNKATLITSAQRLLDTFGRPSESITGQGIEGALEILETTNQLYFIRCEVAGVSKEARAELAVGSCPAVRFEASGFGVTADLYLKVQVWDGAGAEQTVAGAKTFNIPSGTVGGSDTQLDALRKVIGAGTLDDALVAVKEDSDGSGWLVGNAAGQNASIYVEGWEDSGETTEVSAFKGWTPLDASSWGGFDAEGVANDPSSAIKVWGATADPSAAAASLYYEVESLYPGAGYNETQGADGGTLGNSAETGSLGGDNFLVQINDEGVAKESFKCSLTASGATSIETVINTGLENATSEIIQGNIKTNGSGVDIADGAVFSGFVHTNMGLAVDAVSGVGSAPANTALGTITATDGGLNFGRWSKLVGEQTAPMADGVNGDEGATPDQIATAIIGSNEEPKTGMKLLDDDILNISVALIPDIHIQSIQNSLTSLARDTQNFLAVLSPPYAIGGVQNAIDWSNGQATGRTSALNDSYAALYWPWVKVFSVFDGKDRWYDPAVFAVRQMAFTDNVGETWFAPAGFQRGKLLKPTEVEMVLNQGDRDSLYSGGNVVNPIVNFPQQGITIFGQRTTQREPTALDRVNIRRLMILIRKTILRATQRFVFEPNDAFTWEQIENVLNPFLGDIASRRGITEFRVVCDETTNTPIRIDRNELWCKVLIKPTKTAEILIFEVNLTNQSAKLGNL